jgi:hypothetical protein
MCTVSPAADGKYQEVNRVNIFESYLYAVRINPVLSWATYAIAVGCKDSRIFLFDAVGNPNFSASKDIQALCARCRGSTGTHLCPVRGTELQTSGRCPRTKAIASLKGHTHAVAVLAIGASNLHRHGIARRKPEYLGGHHRQSCSKKRNAHMPTSSERSLQVIRDWISDMFQRRNGQTMDASRETSFSAIRGHTSFVFTVTLY